jgi:hypothetical protein
MTSKDLFDNINLREDFEQVNAIGQDRCGHCGRPNDNHKLSYFCRRCYHLMRLGDTTTLVGLADDINEMMNHRLPKEAYDLPPRKFKVIKE